MLQDYEAGEFVNSKTQRKLAEEGRVCDHWSCDTVLSVHNPTDRCALHKEASLIPGF